MLPSTWLSLAPVSRQHMALANMLENCSVKPLQCQQHDADVPSAAQLSLNLGLVSHDVSRSFYTSPATVTSVGGVMLLGLPLQWRWRVHQTGGGGAGLPVAAWPLAPRQEALEGSLLPTHHTCPF